VIDAVLVEHFDIQMKGDDVFFDSHMNLGAGFWGKSKSYFTHVD
jgi:hypothetical protein